MTESTKPPRLLSASWRSSAATNAAANGDPSTRDTGPPPRGPTPALGAGACVLGFAPDFHAPETRRPPEPPGACKLRILSAPDEGFCPRASTGPGEGPNRSTIRSP